MRLQHLRTISLAFFIALFFSSALSTVLADQRPYFKTFGGDIMSGGWNMQSGSCSLTYYQDPFTAGGDITTGGIQAYAKTTVGSVADGGSSSQFAAFATGRIQGGDNINFYGFYSSGISLGVNVSALSFADTPAWGGEFQGTVRQSHCIPDYYGKKPTSTAGLGSLSALTASNAYGVTGVGAPFTVTGTGGGVDVIIAAGKAITIYVDGNAYIDRNIVYQLDTATNVPKFTLIARGSIYIDPAVSRLDGVYVAQPNPSDASPVGADDGVIWTCHPNDTNPVLYTYPTVNCRNKLTLKNGAFIAKQVNLLRVFGDVAAANIGEDTLSTAYTSNNIGEVINFSPAMVIGGPFFNATTNVLNNSLKTNSIISLPPIF